MISTRASLLGHGYSEGQIQRISTPTRCWRDAYRTHRLPWGLKRLWLFPLLAGLRDRRRRGRARVWALNPDQFPDDLVNCFEPDETVLGDDAVRRAIGLFQHGIGLRV